MTLVFFSSAVGCDYLSLASVNKHSEQTQTHASFRLSSSFFLCPRHFFIVFLLFLLVGSASLLVNFHCAKTSVLFASFSLLNAYKLNLDNISCGFASPVCIALFNDVSKSKTKNYCNTAFGRTPQIYLLRLGWGKTKKKQKSFFSRYLCVSFRRTARYKYDQSHQPYFSSLISYLAFFIARIFLLIFFLAAVSICVLLSKRKCKSCYWN